MDAALRELTHSPGGLPGVVAMLTDRDDVVYSGVAGERAAGSGTAMTADTVFAAFSTTKAITGTAALQCVEEGLLDLDAPAARYVPEIGELQVLEGFGTDGEPLLRAPKRDITTRMLLLHTAGLGYDFFDENYRRLAEEHGQPSVITASKAALRTPLLFDPGERWMYGSNIDWCGLVVEAVRGRRLGEVMRERIFEPLGMADTAFTLTADMRDRLAVVHQRGEDGTVVPMPEMVLPQDPEVHMGGHGLYTTVPDYLRFLRMWLRDGDAPGGRVLAAGTVADAVRGGLDGQQITALPGVIPALSNDAEFFPGLPKNWAYTFMVNEEPAPTGRPAGALGWAGLANLYYWIDRQNGIAGFWATQILPFADAVSFGGYLDFEAAAYRRSAASRIR
ncbi:beta-lactamase family protein [Rhodococcus aetherivorans]|jgi:methyl acetate hydrolase|uniref:Beta-lactamase family protein n=2 Tax=Nocardiaceae TaxID=85025 RepID=A0AA46SBQ6_9NOCA|nr:MULTISPECIES: serine hydrolase domain-containing protein [Rhodococcus]MDV6293721.1 serine hydrolase domain-containing protein [Rhodococcus aetherivorans]UGQ44197.1 beta-lactamase family protein [Rhodococcus aetherivorans]UYF96845.1 beta-lactamase family protein [Rhodococcus aetherivorans]WKX01591.1 serine hydrolase domain-containing protein [Rhodococcus aetherivorans]